MNRSEAAERVIQAWTKPGIAPEYHRRKKAELLTEWPSLAHAILALVESEPDVDDPARNAACT